MFSGSTGKLDFPNGVYPGQFDDKCWHNSKANGYYTKFRIEEKANILLKNLPFLNLGYDGNSAKVWSELN
jgi:hypothetical protein